jgi:hypothetical protein
MSVAKDDPASIVISALGKSNNESSQEYPRHDDFGHHLVLHFDINETILVGDEAGGDSREDCIHKMLAKSAFVRIPESYNADISSLEPIRWWNGLPIRDVYDYDSIMETTPPLYVGWEWPTDCCPYYRTKFKKRAKTFCEHHGSLYQSTFHEIQQRLQPKDPHAALDYPILSHMLPSFFETVVALSRRSQRFTLVFRTMGTDLHEIAQAMTAFARGKHPDYPDFSNDDLVLKRDKLLRGRWTNTDDSGNHRYQLHSQNGEIVASGDAQVLEFLRAQTICGIQDDYSFWRDNHWEPWAGKPVWIIDDDSTVQHILLDDNIHNLPHDSIASARTRLPNGNNSFRTLSGPEIQAQQGIHLIRVPTVAPILRPRWFLEQIDSAQRKFVSKTTTNER